MTYLEAINLVLVRLRESEVAAWDASDYTKLIGQLVNEAKREVEDAHEWSSLKTLIDKAIASTATTVTFTGTSQRTRIIALYNTTNTCHLHRTQRDRIVRWRNQATITDAQPSWYALKGYDATSSEVVLELYPGSDGAYTLRLDCINPQDKLMSNGTVITVPPEPVALRAMSLALAERGDDQGQPFANLMAEYKIALDDAVNRDKDNGVEYEAWYVP